MRTLSVAFLKGTFISDRIIKFWTNSKYSHSEFVFWDGSNRVSFGSALEYPFDLRFNYTRQYLPEYWDLIDINISQDNINKIFLYCVDSQYKGYDWTSILFTQFIPFGWQSKDKEFCSKFCYKALTEVVEYLPKRHYPNYVSPQILNEELKKR